MRKAIYCMLLLTSCTSSTIDKDKDEQKQKASAGPTVKEKEPIGLRSPKHAFDVPNLIGKSIDQVSALLGKPSIRDTPNLTKNELERRYTNKGYTLVITYDTITRVISGFSIPVLANSGGVRNCSDLMIVGNLKNNDARYTVDSLEMSTPGYYGSVVVEPN